MCYQRVYDKKDCKDSRYIREDILERMFIEIYNNIVKNKHKTKELLLNTIKNVINDNNYQKSINEIEKIINVPCTLTEFDENTFENFVEKIVVGEVLQNGEKDPNVIRFILKTGSEFKIALTSQQRTN